MSSIKENDPKREKRGGRSDRRSLWIAVASILVICAVIVAVILIVLPRGSSDVSENTPVAEETRQDSGGGFADDGNSGAAEDTEQDSGETGLIIETPESDAGESAAIIEEAPGTVAVVERVEASYERWLAAGMVVAISMQYPDFEINGIYLSGETDLASKSASQGTYVVFTADGTQRAVHSVPLDAERTEGGTMDLYTQDLGFATFDTVDASSVATASMTSVSMDELNDLIAQSLLVSIYEH